MQAEMHKNQSTSGLEDEPNKVDKKIFMETEYQLNSALDYQRELRYVLRYH